MMKMKTMTTGIPPVTKGRSARGDGERAGGGGGGSDGDWELRPGGMLVQKRNPDSDQNRDPPTIIKVRVKYGSIYHEIYISGQSTFGELKKMLSGPTGLHHQDQKLLFKDKERESKAFLDMAGVKDKSKIVLVEDPISQEKRYLEMRNNAKVEKASKSISEISLEVDRLAGQVSALESVISKGGKVAEKKVLNVIELLMNELVKLDGIIISDGDVKLQRTMQVRRVQKYVETLDMLKIKNSQPSSNGNHCPMPSRPSPPIQQHQKQRNSDEITQSPVQKQQQQQQRRLIQMEQQQQPPSRHSTSGDVVITTQWETFDSAAATTLATPTPTSTATSSSMALVHSQFNWDLL